MVEFRDATLTEIKKYLELTGKHGAQILSILGRVTPNIHAILETDVGREILKDDIARIQELMFLIYQEKQTDEDMAELRYLKRRIGKISGRLSDYLEGTGEIKAVAKKE